MPQTINSKDMLDYAEAFGNGKPLAPQGIFYLGNERSDLFGGKGEEAWISDSDARTHMLLMGTTGSGKALDDEEDVLTPEGFVKNKELKVGDEVVCYDGIVANVLSIHPQGYKEFYKLTFEDGREISVSGEHLWGITYGEKDRIETEETKKIIDLLPYVKTYIPLHTINHKSLDKYHFYYKALQNLILDFGVKTNKNYFVILNDKNKAEILTNSINAIGGKTFIKIRSIKGEKYYFASLYWKPEELEALYLNKKRIYKKYDKQHNILKLKNYNKLKIVSISKEVEERICRCIKISNPSGLFITRNHIVTHNTENLFSMSFNALCWGSGFFYIDGKADPKLLNNIYTLCRYVGREDDLLVLNFMQGGKDPLERKATPGRDSNTFNPLTKGSADFTSTLITSMMPEAGGDSKTWQDKAIAMIEALIQILVVKRLKGEMLLEFGTIRKYLPLSKLISLSKDKEIQFEYPVYHARLMSYLDNVPGLDLKEIDKGKPIPLDALTQHGYLTNQFNKTLTLMNDTYGYIFRHTLPDIDIVDVVLNNRILFVLIPSLEKSEPESESLGRMLVATLKLMMAISMGGDKIEGKPTETIETRATNSPNPYLVIFDEIGYYFTKGMDTMFAQARSLGFAMVAAGQDKQAMAKEKNKGPVESVIANTKIKQCMALEDPGETFDIFDKAAGEAMIARSSGYSGQVGAFTTGYNDMMNVSFEKTRRLTVAELRSQKSGQSVILFRDKIVRINTFYVSAYVKPKDTAPVRLNRFLKVENPKLEQIKAFKSYYESSDNSALEVPKILESLMLNKPFEINENKMPLIYFALQRAIKDCNEEEDFEDTYAIEKGILYYERLKYYLENPDILKEKLEVKNESEEFSSQNVKKVEEDEDFNPFSMNMPMYGDINDMPFTGGDEENVIDDDEFLADIFGEGEISEDLKEKDITPEEILKTVVDNGEFEVKKDIIENLTIVENSISCNLKEECEQQITNTLNDAVKYKPEVIEKLKTAEEIEDLFSQLEL